ncbi:type IV pilus twitching motility protein PilT [Erwinia tracheiphila]|uniref:Bacterial type II secretion system protein E domain-containing protein n=1 Tax=Erwinia tracheiphila TaxID=65700 RepID=A0A0M2KDW2_9GAMM|nr:type IV pilus twitching motility protein PilT [Erwinia tracheiphila]EOS95904.1 twitching motility family protein [Erwinia tracheiphila PSU-1]KKF35477.1 hypothetical protein SY86_08650 [Erwinia tracheiphila]UIA87143.1 type IV pilus twitching motility protein PilT [Erwinia tracheiphila]UIA95503.1 type IV pilus twitching motility protein PilT [Erwinia tracheiphila]
MHIEDIVALSVKHKAGDLHLCSGYPPFWRRDGRLQKIADAPPVSNEVLHAAAQEWLDGAQQVHFEQAGQIDFALTFSDGVRVRANLFRQRQGLSLALRIINGHISGTEQLELPQVTRDLLQLHDGLVLVTGATGSGKSTTLAALTGEINQHQARHILTLEDPIEFIHHSARSLVQQREIGTHCVSFSEGLRAALREDPDVILLGELRDKGTIQLALTAAETGHLVLATLHTRGAVQAVDRLVDVFPGAEKDLIRTQLAGSLKVVIAQKLVPAVKSGRVALFEVLVSTTAVANLIREGKTHQLPAVLETGVAHGMQSFRQSLAARRQAGQVE